ncbi:hypothetical protein ACFT9I_19270 [Streptomyces sp. NPDC057137]|uniref:hypothetical protein n=1 Tax=Streptomyces sp. NPDC057137 TaxID=3346030 RepID=UPI0036360FDB
MVCEFVELPGTIAAVRATMDEDRTAELDREIEVLGPCSLRASTPVDGGLRPLCDPGAGGLDEDGEK